MDVRLPVSDQSAWGRILKRVAERWPEHMDFLTKSLTSCSPEVHESGHRTARLIEHLVGEKLDVVIDGYRWMCEMVLEEEIEFRRSGSYRYSTFEDANREVYSNTPIMEQYMAGLLLSQVLWSNHLATFDFYARKYVSRLDETSRHLEVGPGHGLLFYEASERNVAELAGWDVSPTSLCHTAASLAKLGITRKIALEERDLFSPLQTKDRERFDSIVLSEVLEHVEHPQDALRILKHCLAPKGRIFVNAPVNAPALDHIYLFREPEQLIDLIRDTGFIVDDVLVAPATGYSEQRARRLRVVMSVAVIAHV